jgi:hemolysin III
MGWVGIFAIGPMTENLSTPQLAWIVAGGLTYTAGVPFYVWKSRRYMHAVWHLFVLGGVACHFAAVLSVVDARGV